MSDKKVVLEDQAKLTQIQIDTVEEIQDHLVKAQSLIDVIANSIEAKNKDNTLDLASELNSMASVYDDLNCAINDTDEVLEALKGIVCVDDKDE